MATSYFISQDRIAYTPSKAFSKKICSQEKLPRLSANWDLHMLDHNKFYAYLIVSSTENVIGDVIAYQKIHTIALSRKSWDGYLLIVMKVKFYWVRPALWAKLTLAKAALSWSNIQEFSGIEGCSVGWYFAASGIYWGKTGISRGAGQDEPPW